MKPDWGLFTYLHGAGRTEAHKWLDRHRRDVGRYETARLKERILGEAAAAPSTEGTSNVDDRGVVVSGPMIARRA